MPVKVFIAYSHADEPMRQELVKHLSPLKRSGLIEEWHDRCIEPGADWNQEIDRHLNNSRIVLPLISADFIDSDYCYGVEMKRALDRHERGETRVIPIILRPCGWHELPFGKLQALPKDGRPVTIWSDRDEAYTDIARGIRGFIEALPRQAPPQASAARPTAPGSVFPEGSAVNSERGAPSVIESVLTIISEEPLPPASVGIPYSQCLRASGGVPPYVWDINPAISR